MIFRPRNSLRLVSFLLFLLALFIVSGVRAADDRTAGAFSEASAGSRSLGMGDAFVAPADDAYAMVANPAGLATMDRASLTFDYSDLYGLRLMRHSYLAGVLPTRWGTHGVSYRGLGIRFDPFPQTYDETTLSYSYARMFGPTAIGTTLKYQSVTSDFQEGTATGYSMDLGLQYFLTDRWTLGASAQNVVSNLRWGTGLNESIPTSWRLGAAVKLSEKWTVTGEYEGVEGDWFNRVKLGTEYWLLRPSVNKKPSRTLKGPDEDESLPFAFAVRGGFSKQQSGDNRVLPALGTSLGFGSLRFDYAYQFSNRSLGASHRYTLNYDFEPWIVKKKDEPVKKVGQEAENKEYARRQVGPAPPPVTAAPRTADARDASKQKVIRSGARVGVLDFTNATGESRMDWLEPGFSEVISRALEKEGFPVVERSGLVGTASFSGPDMLALASRENARMIIRGVFVREEERGGIILTARLIDGYTGRTLEYVETRGSELEIFEMGDQIAKKAISWVSAVLK